MHLRRALIAAGALIAVASQAAHAFSSRTVVVVGNLGPRTEDVRTRLGDRLRAFAGRVRDFNIPQQLQQVIPPNLQHPRLTFEVRPRNLALPDRYDNGVEPGTDQLMGEAGVAAMWGSFGRAPRENVATSTIYIGSALPIDHSLRNHPTRFIPVRASLAAPVVDLNAYEIIIEYALLRRVWREGRVELVIPVGAILKQRLREVRPQAGDWIDCHNAIQAATTDIMRQPRRPAGPVPARINQPDPITCS